VTPRIVRAIIRLEQRASLDTVAEGVELPEQAEILQSLHCPAGAGLLFFRPLPARELRVSGALG